MIIIPTFRTVSIGNEHSDLSRELRSAGVYLDRVASSIVATLGAVQAHEKTIVDTVLITPQELGFSKNDFMNYHDGRFCTGLPHRQLFDRARNFGLIKCRDMVAPELLLQYAEDLKNIRGRWIRVCMNPLSGGPVQEIKRAFSFGVGRNGLSLATSDNLPRIGLAHLWLFEKSH